MLYINGQIANLSNQKGYDMANPITRSSIDITSKGIKYLLFLLLILLNLVLRIPSIPHEKGYDSFYLHSLANSISIFGDAQWWVHWLSVFGFYAYSYASAVPYALSGINQLTSIEMELVVLVYCTITGIIAIFTSYILAGKISNKFSYKYFVALFFSVAPGVMLFSTWEVSSRGLFIIFLPLFIYLLLSQMAVSKKTMLLLILLVFQFAVHHYGFILLPIVMLYLFFVLLKKTKYYTKAIELSPYILIIMLFALIILPFISRSLISSGSRYSWLITSSITIVRQVGPIAFVAVGGFIYTLFKKNKSTYDLYLLCLLTMFMPAIYSHIYGAYILLLFIILFVGPSFVNIVDLNSHKKVVSVFLVTIILVSVSFTGFFNHYRTGDSESFWYMDDGTYVAGIWGREHIPDNSYGLDTAFQTGRMFAISEGHPITPTASAGNLAYGFINESEIEYVEYGFLDKAFYFEGPYTVKPGTTVSGKMEWLRQTASNIDQLQGFDYFVQDKYYSKPVTFVVDSHYNKIYDGSRIAIWRDVIT